MALATPWLFYWSRAKTDTWKSVPAHDLAALLHDDPPRYVTILATTVTDDPSTRAQAEYDGPLVIDIDRKPEHGGKAAAIQDVQKTARRLTALGVELSQLQWYASGEKGFHIVLPAAIFKAGRFTDQERRHLPMIYRELVRRYELYCDGIDLSLYAAGRGKMLRQANVLRENGKYKVPLTVDEVMRITPVQYDEFVTSPRSGTSAAAPKFSGSLGALFEVAKADVLKAASRRPRPTTLTLNELEDLPSNVAVIEAVKREALGRIENLLPNWLPGGEWQGDRYVVRNPMRDDRHAGSFIVWADGGFLDFACPADCSGGDLVALYAYLNEFGGQMEDAARKVALELDIDLDATLGALPHRQVMPKEGRTEVKAPQPTAATKSPRAPSVSNVTELLVKDFPPVRWIVQDVLPAGVTLFAAAPKTGKSWLALDIAICVAAGVPTLGSRKTTQGRVLLLALEDNEPRLKNRLTAVMATRSVVPNALDYATAWERIGLGGTSFIDDWLARHEDAALVVVDTLAKIKPDLKANKDRYAQEYAAMSELKALSDRYGISILVITHTRKQAGEDPMDAISGSLGLSGGVDNTWVMKKARGEKQAALFVIGRDIVDEVNYGLQWDADGCVWSIEGTATEVLASSGRQEVLAAIRKASAPVSVEDIAAVVGKDRSTVQRTLTALLESDAIARSKAGKSFRYAVSQ